MKIKSKISLLALLFSLFVSFACSDTSETAITNDFAEEDDRNEGGEDEITSWDVSISPEGKIFSSVGDSFFVKAFYSNGSSTRNVSSDVVWKVQDESVLEINEEEPGKFKALSKGVSTIFFEYNGDRSEALIVEVEEIEFESIEFSEIETQLIVGTKKEFKVFGKYNENLYNITALCDLEISNLNVVKLEQSDQYYLKALKSGSVKLKASYKSFVIEKEILVPAENIDPGEITDFEIEASYQRLVKGQEIEFKAKAKYRGEEIDLTRLGKFISSNSGALKNIKGNLFEALSQGDVLLTFRIEGKDFKKAFKIFEFARIDYFIENKEIPVGLWSNLAMAGIDGKNQTIPLGNRIVLGSSDSAIVKIGKDNRLEALKVGSAIIEGKIEDLSFQVEIKVIDAQVTDLSLLPINPGNVNPFKLAAGMVSYVRALATYSDGNTVDVSRQSKFKTQDKSILSIDLPNNEGGLIEAISPGSTVLEVKFANFTAYLDVEITDAVLKSLEISPKNLSLPVGDTRGLQLTAIYSDNRTELVTWFAGWSTDNNFILEVKGRGQITGLKKGIAEVSAEYGNMTAKIKVEVNDAVLRGIDVFPSSIELIEATLGFVNVTGRYSDGSNQGVNGQVLFSSDNPSVVEVNTTFARGLLTAKSVGKAIITASIGQLKTNISVEVVKASLTDLQLAPSTTSIPENTFEKFSVQGVFDNNTTQDLSFFADWSSDNGNILYVENTGSNKGLVRAISAGKANLKASYGGLTVSREIKVESATLDRIEILPYGGISNGFAGSKLLLSQTAGLYTQGIFSSGDSKNITFDTTFTSSDNSIAVIGNSLADKGRIYPRKAGKVTFTAEYQGVSANLEITVADDGIKNIWLVASQGVKQYGTPTGDKLQLELPVDGVTIIQVIGLSANQSNVNLTGDSYFKISDESIAEISNARPVNGLITTKKAGKAKIFVEYGSFKEEASIEVVNASLSYLEVSPVNVKIPVGLVRTLNVIGVYSDGSRSSLNAFCNFISKDPNVVEISSIFGTSDEKGKVTAKSAGKADIDIFCYGKSISTSIEVTDDKLTELFVSPSQSDVLISNTQIAGINNLRFNADGKFDSGEIYNLSFQSQWFSSDETKCKIFNSFGLKGLVQLLSTGTCEIWAEFDGIKSKAAKVNIR